MNKNNCRQSRIRPGHLLRQTLAVALAFSLFAGLATPAFADNAVAPTAHKPSNAENEMPKITLQINGVIDEQTKKFTEYVEVAVLVESGVKYYDSTHAEISKDTFDDNAALATPVAGYTAEVQAFRYLSLALEYNAEILTPVAWGDPTTGVNAPTPVLSDPYTASFKNQVIFPTLKGKANTTAIAHVSGPTDAVVAANTSHNSTGLFYLMAEADKPVELTTPTALAVVRFQYTPSTDAASYLTDPAHMLLTDSTPWAALNKASEATSGAYRETDVTAWQNAPDENWLVRFAPDAVVGAPSTAAPDAVQLLYRSSSNAFYYMTEVNSSTGVITTGARCVPLYAEDDTADPQSPLYQLLNFGSDGKKNIRMVYTNRPTFDSSGGLDYSKLTACVIVDADNTILGTVIVPKNADVRQLINDYVRDNFVYEYTDGTTDSLRTLTSAQVASLERMDTYRGKYPAAAPAVDGSQDATTVKDANGRYIGESYPLTNKLDYVFFKRPMERVATGKPDVNDTTAYPGGENNAAYQADYANWLATAGWKQKEGATATTPLYDTEYPFAYGWALCTQDNYQDTWTWLGSNGELSNYAKDANGFATVTYQNGAEGVNFAFADLKTGFTTGQDTVFLKAVYEPGTSNIGPYMYRFIKSPYYNKLNSNTAEGGGAYSATFTLERSNNDQMGDGKVYGVEMIREPVVRQAVTTDNLWEENQDIGVNHNLPSPTLPDTQGFLKSTFIKVDVTNGEQIAVQLAMSARMNKIDWELQDMWGKNFVGGNARIRSNTNSMTDVTDKGDWIPDNYNYYVDGESSDTDDWYDAPYKYREGSYGFVLFGTLNAIMEKATARSRDPNDSNFNSYVGIGSLNDINISLDGNPVTAGNVGTLRTRIIAAAADAEIAYLKYKANPNDPDGSADWWDVEHDCAQLTYHQLQNYILTCDNSNKNGDLLSDATEADPIPALTWCHLHAACASNLANVPTDWDGLLSVARSADPSALGTMKTAEIEQYFHLRSDANGTALSPAQFQTKLVQAVTDLDAIAGNTTTIWSWDLVQDRMIRGAGYDSTGVYSQEHYWWYDGATAMNFATLAETVNAAIDALEAPLMPDGSQTATRTAKIAMLEPIFDANASAADVTTGWRNATKDLAITKNSVEGEKFDTFHDTVNDADNFLEHLYAALTDAKTANGGTIPTLSVAASASDIREYWNKLQYHILHGSYPISPTPAQQTEMDGYWWYDGHVQIKDLPTLLKAAKLAAADEHALDELDLSLLYSTTNTSFHFRSGFNGTTDVYTSATLGDLKTKLAAFAGPISIPTPAQIDSVWNQLQYYLIHNTTGNGGQVGAESPYYWWKNGDNGSASATDFSGVNNWSTGLSAVLDAAFKAEISGNPHAWDNLTDTIIDNARLVEGENSATTWAGLTHFSGTSSFLSKIDGLSAAAGSKKPGPTQAIVVADDTNTTWQQVQYYLLNSKTFTDATTADNAGYWWRTSNENLTPLARFNGGDGTGGLVAALQEYWDNGDADPLDAWLTEVDNLNAVFVNPNSGDGKFTQDDADMFLGSSWAFDNIIYSGDFSSADDVSWYHFQWWIINMDYSGMNAADTAADLASWSPPITAPAWLVSAGLDSIGTPTPLMLNTSTPVALMMVEPTTATSEDGLTTAVTDSDYTVDEETGSWTLTQTVTSTTRTDSFEVVTTTITTTTFDPETGLTDTVTEVTNSVLTYETNAEESPAPSGEVVTPVDPTPVEVGDYAIEPDAVIVIGTGDPVDEPAEPTVEEPPEEPAEEPVEEPVEEPAEETTPPAEEPAEPTDADPPEDADTGPTETDSTIQTVDTTETTEEEGEEPMMTAPETSATARLNYWSPPDPGETYMVVYGPPAYSINRMEVIA